MDIGTINSGLITVLLGALGGGLGLLFRSSALVFLGPVVLIGFYQISIETLPGVPSWIRLCLQIAAGFLLGIHFSQISFGTLKPVLKPAATIAGVMLLGGMAIGYVISCLTGWDFKTCLLATTFGGQTEMLLIAEGAGAQTEKVLILQFFRNQAALLLIFPLSRLFVIWKEDKNRGAT